MMKVRRGKDKTGANGTMSVIRRNQPAGVVTAKPVPAPGRRLPRAVEQTAAAPKPPGMVVTRTPKPTGVSEVTPYQPPVLPVVLPISPIAPIEEPQAVPVDKVDKVELLATINAMLEESPADLTELIGHLSILHAHLKVAQRVGAVEADFPLFFGTIDDDTPGT